MPTIIPSSFTKVEFTDEEFKAAKTFPPLNKLYLVSLRGQTAEDKLRLKFDPAKPHDFLQEEAALAGRLLLLDELIGELQ